MLKKGFSRSLSIVVVLVFLFTTIFAVGTVNAQGIADTHLMKYGIFCHYVPGLTVNTSGVVVTDPNTLANNFDATQFANDLAAMKVKFVIFTAWHKNMVCLWPSAAMTKWLPTGHTTTRDVLGDMITAVKAKGIHVLFYTHPRDGHDFNAADQAATGWSPFNYTTWNNFINDIYADLITRYGSQIDGIYLDEGGHNDTYLDMVRLRNTVKSINPDLLMIQNNYYGTLYTADEGDQEFYYWGPFTAGSDGTLWTSYSRGCGPVFASNWWASVASGTNTVTWSAASMFKYTVLQAGTNTDGLGVQWAAGPYSGTAGGFETGVVSTMTAVGNLIAPIASSIENTLPSTSYVTKPLSTISGLTWGVATRSSDDSIEYIHVLKAPGTKTLTLPVPADGKLFGTASLVSNGNAVTLTQAATAVTLTLGSSDNWDANDTAIKLTVTGKRSDLALGKLVLTTSAVDTDNNWGNQKVTDGITTSVAGTSMGYSSSLPTATNHTEDLTVDLGANNTVSRVVLWPRSDSPNTGYGFPIDFTIKLSTDNVNWTTVVTKTGYANPGAVPQTFNFTAATARYVRVEGTNLRQNPNDLNYYRMQFAEMGVYNTFSDNFTSGFANNWTANSGTWSVASGMYNQSLIGTANTTIPQSAWSDATFEYDFQITNNNGNTSNWAGCNIRKTNLADTHDNSGYMVYCRSNGEVCLYKPTGNLATYSSGLTFSTLTHMKIVTSGNNIQVFVNNSPTPNINYTDTVGTTYSSGYFGLETYYVAANYDNVSIH